MPTRQVCRLTSPDKEGNCTFAASRVERYSIGYTARPAGHAVLWFRCTFAAGKPRLSAAPTALPSPTTRNGSDDQEQNNGADGGVEDESDSPYAKMDV